LKIHADFHSHSHYSRDSVLNPRTYIDRCLKRGIDVIAVTDHNEIEGAFVIQKLAPPELKVIIGEEVKTAEGEIIGLFLHDIVPRDMSPEDTVRAIHEQGGMAVIPHPFDTFRRSVLTGEAIERVKTSVDAIEGFNCRNIIAKHDAKARDPRRQRRQADHPRQRLAFALGARRRGAGDGGVRHAAGVAGQPARRARRWQALAVRRALD